MKKKIQKPLILAFEVIVCNHAVTYPHISLTIFLIFRALCCAKLGSAQLAAAVAALGADALSVLECGFISHTYFDEAADD